MLLHVLDILIIAFELPRPHPSILFFIIKQIFVALLGNFPRIISILKFFLQISRLEYDENLKIFGIAQRYPSCIKKFQWNFSLISRNNQNVNKINKNLTKTKEKKYAKRNTIKITIEWEREKNNKFNSYNINFKLPFRKM